MAKLARSPLAPKGFPRLAPVAGVRLASTAAGLGYRRRRDLLLVELAEGTAVAGVLTRSQTAAAPVAWCRRALKGGAARALVVNAGNANAFTGRAGEHAVAATVSATAQLLGCAESAVFAASTGVIGEPVTFEPIVDTLPGLKKGLKTTGWREAAEAIRTTDTYSKGAGQRTAIAGKPVVITGIAKGSGMIAPDMATMLAFLFTDAKLPPAVLSSLLRRANAVSFNAITVDSDTSTNDTVLLFATGRGARHARITSAADPRLGGFQAALEAVMTKLAHQIVRDGEGATKFIEVAVTGAASTVAARRIARAVADSPLVKTALAGADPNWGRIVMAVGKAGERINPERLAIRFGDQLVTESGAVHPGYDEAKVARYLERRDIAIAIDVGVGRAQARVWTCDLTHGYIAINADYRS